MSATKGTIRTSTILIASTGGSGARPECYRSLEEIPPRLRKRVLKCTSGSNSATILIADRRGREELSKAVKGLPSGIPERLREMLRPLSQAQQQNAATSACAGECSHGTADARERQASRMWMARRLWLEGCLLGGAGALIWLLFWR
jgi:hypothetical protein